MSEPPQPPLPRPSWPLAALAAWCTLVIGCVAMLTFTGRWQPRGPTDAWLADADRLPRDLSLLELRISDAEPADEQRLADAAEQVGELLGERRVALAPPLHALASWLDARGWWLVDPSGHAELATRLEPEAIDTAIGDLRAELTSPFALLDLDERRRDPLDLRARWLPMQGHFGDDVPNVGVRASDRGDWLAADGSGLLVGVRTSDPVTVWLPEIEDTARRLGLSVQRTDVAAREAAAASRLRSELPRFLAVALTALALTLALGLRSASLTGLVLVSLGAGLSVFLTLGGAWSPSATPVAVALVASLASLAAGFDAPPEERQWSVLGAAIAWLAALAAPWPALRDAAIPAVVAMLIASFPLRFAAVHAGATTASAAGLDRARTWGGTRRVALGLALTVPGLAAVVYASGWGAREGVALRRDGADPIASLGARYVDLDARAWIEDTGKDEVEALDAASTTARTLATTDGLLGLDAIGLVALAEDTLPERREALGKLNLRARAERVIAALEASGLRPDAFGEFVDNLDQLARPPTAADALASPLRPWLAHATSVTEQSVVVRTSLHVPRELELPEVVRPDGSIATWRGPAAAARRDAARLVEHLLVILAGVAWAVAFAVWMVTRRFDVAMLATAIGISALGLGLAVVLWQGSPLSPRLAPGAMVVLGTTATCAARVCLVLLDGTPRAASTLLLGVLAPAIVGAALVLALPSVADAGVLLLAGCGTATLLVLVVPPVMLVAPPRTPTRRPAPDEPSPRGDSSPSIHDERAPPSEEHTP